jgi:hypothetical protein
MFLIDCPVLSTYILDEVSSIKLHPRGSRQNAHHPPGDRILQLRRQLGSAGGGISEAVLAVSEINEAILVEPERTPLFVASSA